MNMQEIFWDAPLESVKRGYTIDNSGNTFTCILCGKNFEKGRIYPDDTAFYDAEKYTQRHILKSHGSVFEFLLKMDKKYTGLTDLQKNLLEYFYQ